MTAPRNPDLQQSKTYRFLSGFRVQGAAPFNLLSLAGGKWNVPDEAYEEFLSQYQAEHLLFHLAFVESKSDVFPFFLDIDVKAGAKAELQAVVQEIVGCLEKTVFPKFHLTAGEVLHSNREHGKDGGWHLIFPEVRVSKPQAQHLRKELVSALDAQHTGRHWDRLVDECVMKANGLRMLGSFKYKAEKGSPQRLPEPGCYMPLLKVSGCLVPQPITLDLLKRSSIHLLGDCQSNVELTLPPESTVNSGHVWGGAACEQPLHTCTIESHQSASSIPELDVVQSLLDCLDGRRAEEYDNWRDVCYALVECVTEATAPQLLAMYHKWSEQSEKYKSDAVEQLWHSALARKHTYGQPKIRVGSLFAWAKQDNPRVYETIADHQKKTLVDKKLAQCNATKGDFSFAELFQLMHGKAYVCSDAKLRTFYKFHAHRWRQCHEGELSIVLSRQVRQAFLRKVSAFQTQAEAATSDVQKKELAERESTWQQSADCLLRSGVKSSILCEVRNLLYDDAFYQDLDSNVHLLGFENGVFDLDAGTFRPGRLEDRVSFSVGYDFAPSDDFDVQADIMAFINSCFDDGETAEHLLNVTASCLHGYRRLEQFYILKGRGRNGKGASAELVKYTFGDYFATIDMSFFTQPRKSSSAASPELADKKGKRYLLSTEPEASEKVQVSKLKTLTGGDTIQARQLYSQPIYFKPQFGIFFQTNDMPELSKIDGGAEQRVQVFDFPFVFTGNPSKSYHRPLDPSLKQAKVVSLPWRQQFMRMLIHRYNTHVKHARVLLPPQSVLKHTQDYLDDCNPVKAWLHEHCTFTELRSDKVKPTDLYNHYKQTADSPVGSKTFYQALEYNEVKKIKSGTQFYAYIKLKDGASGTSFKLL